MGAINYLTSDYITLAFRPYDYNEIEEAAMEYGCTPDDIISDYQHADFENAKAIVDDYSFYYYDVHVKPGYYEGSQIVIENNYPVCYDDYIDKREAQKEITQIKMMLLECADVGMVETFPGWCTGYSDHKGTVKAIKEAVKDMRAQVEVTPTWIQYERKES